MRDRSQPSCVNWCPVLSRTVLLPIMTISLMASIGAQAAPLKTRNVVLIVSDGLRWQEVFTGADPELLKKPPSSGVWANEQDLRREFWRDDAGERRKALLPFLWTTVAAHGQIFGNQARGSVARVTNGRAFSYPGYNEMLTGRADPRIDSNSFGPNPNATVFEWLNGQPDLHGRVRVYATWEAFKDIFNVGRSHLPSQIGWDTPYPGATSPRERLLNRLYESTTPLDDRVVYDAFLQVQLLDSLAQHRPRVVFVGYGETDDWGHADRYDLVLRSAHRFDHYVEELWNTLQRQPAYRNQTTFIITTDHGRGSGPEWRDHGAAQKGSEDVWIAVLGPDTAPLGERSDVPELHQAQIAATVAALLGRDYRKAVPQAEAPIADALGGGR